MRVAHADEKPRLVVVHDVGEAADLRRDDGAPGCQGLDDRHRRALVGGGEDDGVAHGVPRRHVLLVAEEEARLGDTEVMRALLEARPVVAVADEHEERVDSALPELP